MFEITLSIGPSEANRGIDWIVTCPDGMGGIERLDWGGWGNSGHGRPASKPSTSDGWLALARRRVRLPSVGGRRLRWNDAVIVSARGDGDYRNGAKFTWSLVALAAE